MTQEAASFVIWKPEHDGHAPPNWREGMKWAVDLNDGTGFSGFDTLTEAVPWNRSSTYRVPPEALNSPNDDAAAEQKIERVEIVVGSKRQREVVSLNELARLIKGGAAIYGITLAPEKDWATELWADLMEAGDMKIWERDIRKGKLRDYDQAAIDLIRERVVLKDVANAQD